MARRRDINDIDEDEEGQIVDYSGDSDNGDKPTEILPEDKFRRRPAPDLGALDTSQPFEFSVLREDDELLVRSNQAFRGETTLPMGVELPKASTHLKMLEKLQELFPEMVEGVQWDLTEGGFRNVLDFLASIRVAELAKILDDENLPLTHGVNWNELGRDYRCFRQQGIEVNIYDLLDCSTDDDQVTLLTLLDHSNIIRNMSLHDTRRTNFVLSELLIWTKYLQCALQKMYEVAYELYDEKEALKDDLAVAQAKLASNDTELSEAHEEVSRLRHEQQLLQQQVTDLNIRAEQIKTSHIEALKEADARARNLERSKAESDHSLKSEINRLSRQLAIRESSNTPMSAMTRSLPGARSTNRRGGEHDDSSNRLGSIHSTPQRGRHDKRTTSGSSDTPPDRPATLVHSIAYEAEYLKGGQHHKR